MSSKVLKGGAAAEARAFQWRGDPERPAAGVHSFALPRAGGGVQEQPAPVAPPSQPPVDVDAIRKQAFQEGLQAGKDAAEKRLAERVAMRDAELQRLLDSLSGYKAALRAESEAELVELAFAIARRIVRRELTVDPSAVTALVKSCMQDMPAVGVKRVLVHPGDLPLVQAAIGPGVEAAADDTIARGGALLETDQGLLDARIDTQLEEIALGLADA